MIENVAGRETSGRGQNKLKDREVHLKCIWYQFHDKYSKNIGSIGISCQFILYLSNNNDVAVMLYSKRWTGLRRSTKYPRAAK